MDSRLYIAAQSGDQHAIKEFENQLHIQRTPNKNTVLHVLAQFCDSADAVNQILAIRSNLLLELNVQSETALHIAARKGRFHVVRALIASAKPHQLGWLLLYRNRDGNSALHEAAMNNRNEIVEHLVRYDKDRLPTRMGVGAELMKFTWFCILNFLPAIKSRDQPILKLFTENKEFTVNNARIASLISLTSSSRRTAWHAAAMSNSTDLVRMISEKFPQLTREVDESGMTPLHYAVRLNSREIVRELLVKDRSVAYVKSEKLHNMTAFHLAVYHGQVDVMQELLFYCPDCWEMVNQQGRNVIHLAVESEEQAALDFILGQTWASDLINQKDINGDTPLHLYAKTKELLGYNLINHPEANKNAFNDDCLTPLDLVPDQPRERCSLIKAEFARSGVTEGFQRIRRKNTEASKGEVVPNESALQGAGDNSLLVATLITTVTFAAGFTLPGGYDSDDGPKKGKAILSNTAAFKAFVVSDSVALLASLFAISCLFRFKIYNGDRKNIDSTSVQRLEQLLLGLQLIDISLRAMLVAFATGLWVVLPSSLMVYKIFICATCVLGLYFAY